MNVDPIDQQRDQQRCPLCGSDNQCAHVRQQETGVQQEPCWCSRAHFDAALLARVPENARNKACVCARCVQSSLHSAPAVAIQTDLDFL